MDKYRRRFAATQLGGRPGRVIVAVIICLIAAFYFVPGAASAPWPFFRATTLMGKSIGSDRLIGQPTLLIITPSRDAAEATREWVKALREKIDQDKYYVRDVLAVDLPFFMTEEDAITRAKEAVPKRYHDQTWILDSPVLEDALGVPRDSGEACIVVLDHEGKVAARVHGPLSEHRLNTVVDALKSLK